MYGTETNHAHVQYKGKPFLLPMLVIPVKTRVGLQMISPHHSLHRRPQYHCVIGNPSSVLGLVSMLYHTTLSRGKLTNSFLTGYVMLFNNHVSVTPTSLLLPRLPCLLSLNKSEHLCCERQLQGSMS